MTYTVVEHPDPSVALVDLYRDGRIVEYDVVDTPAGIAEALRRARAPKGTTVTRR